MRYLAESFACGALRRGRPVEQFLGPLRAADRLGIHYIEVRPVRYRYEIILHACEDVGHESFCDLAEFPSFHGEDGEEDSGLLLATSDEPLDALRTAENLTGAVRGRWVNEGLVQDEYHDYLQAGRPVGAAHDGHPWPKPPAAPPTPVTPASST
ncbi:hypothetical protein [Streptomyces sp. SID3343]|uniref:hypothetical protein n=1 Tax=Streptomyces sp. SID3343 TaxID=2690260 RepID=UPI001928D1B2|nr:hypothetical protein [Streptomyces sp. SID3343]